MMTTLQVQQRGECIFITGIKTAIGQPILAAQQSAISHVKIKNMKKVLRCHQCALDFEKGFIAKILEGSDFHYKTEIEDGAMVSKENWRKRKKPL